MNKKLFFLIFTFALISYSEIKSFLFPYVSIGYDPYYDDFYDYPYSVRRYRYNRPYFGRGYRYGYGPRARRFNRFRYY